MSIYRNNQLYIESWLYLTQNPWNKTYITVYNRQYEKIFPFLYRNKKRKNKILVVERGNKGKIKMTQCACFLDAWDKKISISLAVIFKN